MDACQSDLGNSSNESPLPQSVGLCQVEQLLESKPWVSPKCWPMLKALNCRNEMATSM